MCGRGFCSGGLRDREPRLGVGVGVDAIGAIVTVRARVVLTGFPVPRVILRIFSPMDVFFVDGVPGVLSAGAVQDD